MCGIVAYIGKRPASPILINGLKRLEYRGYDSAGIALIEDGQVIFEKAAGKIRVLEDLIEGKSFQATAGIAHTRWATHGVPNDINAHPHLDCHGKIAVVHNGIIENFKTLRSFLERRGHTFESDTDTEIIAHLIEEYYDDNLTRAVQLAMSQVEGTYGIAVISLDAPDVIVAARHGSPLALGLGENENLVASDVSAMLEHTKKVVYLNEGEVATVSRHGIQISTMDNVPVPTKYQEIEWDLDQLEKSGFDHFMLKEIYEQPTTIRNAMRGRLNYEEGTSRLSGLKLQYDQLLHVKRIILSACGTSWHAALCGEYMIEEFARIPVEVEYASEFRYRAPIIDEGTLVFVISQSGETADTLAALREAKRKGATVLGICNVVGSTIARETDGGIYIHAGPEIGVASTKAFTSQVTVLALLTILLARQRSMSMEKGRQLIEALELIPDQVTHLLRNDHVIREIAEQYARTNNFLYLGRGVNFPVALEGALKLKEISYIHAEGYPAAEMKHGPIALIDENMPVVVLAQQDMVYDKVISNIQEVKARNGKIIALATEGDEEIARLANHVIYLPKVPYMLNPIIAAIPLQLLAYHIAVLRGCDVDQPRNLAKSVTVE
ncbi:MAG: glutamine--fructose-6-phosphate transaminase (isomerizing) [candidate division Zixibacteria bacterium]|nr:glutamine--fructose-6-phosphate transaminase (isomerizing) [candidate division Zixibacteria bacterium]